MRQVQYYSTMNNEWHDFFNQRSDRGRAVRALIESGAWGIDGVEITVQWSGLTERYRLKPEPAVVRTERFVREHLADGSHRDILDES